MKMWIEDCLGECEKCGRSAGTMLKEDRQMVLVVDPATVSGKDVEAMTAAELDDENGMEGFFVYCRDCAPASSKGDGENGRE